MYNMSKRIVKCTIIGDTHVGKSSIIERIITNNFSNNMETTLGASYFSKSINIDNIPTEIQYWDTAGQERYNSLIPMYLRSANIILLVFDLSSPYTLQNLTKWNRMLQICLQNQVTKLIIIGNKSDIKNQLDKTSIQEKLSNIEHDYYIEVSAKTNKNIEKIRTYILLISKHIPHTCKTNLILSEPEKNKKKCCH